MYGAFVHLLRQGDSFSVRPIVLGSSMQIHDGRHRLFAAFEVWGSTAPNGVSKSIWDRLG